MLGGNGLTVVQRTMASNLMDGQHQLLEAADFDYLFTESELSELLGIIETQQGKSVDAFDASSQPLLPSQVSAPVALQFQPHPVEAAHASPQQAAQHQGYAVPVSSGPYIRPPEAMFPPTTCAPAPVAQAPGDQFVLPGCNGVGAGYGEAICSQPMLMMNMHQPGQDSVLQAQGQSATPQQMAFKQESAVMSHNAAPQPSSSAGSKSTGAKAGKEGKAHVSHSTIEKQRRDRINSLIDELRDLVPPSGHVGGDPSDTKRPKHVVLSDTIALVKELQKARASSPSHNSEGNEADSSDLLSGDTQQQGPGVLVERKKDSALFVKVTCADRRGLLADIITSLKSLPLQISRAAVTTHPDGSVQDVFEVFLDPDCSSDLDSIQEQIHTAVFQQANLRDKRRRA